MSCFGKSKDDALVGGAAVHELAHVINSQYCVPISWQPSCHEGVAFTYRVGTRKRI